MACGAEIIVIMMRKTKTTTTLICFGQHGMHARAFFHPKDARPSAFAKGCNEPRTDLRFHHAVTRQFETRSSLRCDVKISGGEGLQVKFKIGCVIHCTLRKECWHADSMGNPDRTGDALDDC